MKTPAANRESLRDGRELYMDGARIPGVTEAPAFVVPIRYAAADFEHDDPRYRETRPYTIVSYRAYNLAGAKHVAREAAGIADGIAQEAAAAAKGA
ncbi:MAG: hypothetical protein IIA41_14870 [SAR324 cluster bacterium]|nr:hypothetical protein [SAR324 cluster bacterium]